MNYLKRIKHNNVPIFRILPPLALSLSLGLGSSLAGCGSSDSADASASNGLTYVTREETTLNDNYRTYYEIFVYSFYDSDGDGIGDLKGVEEKLDYLNDGDPATDTDLGITGIWLMPVMPSTTYHKYDVTDYMGIDAEYGTMEEFDSLIAACHDRGIDVIIDLPMNHTSSQHSWFQQAAAFLKEHSADTIEELDTAECPYVDYYHFTTTPASGYTQIEDTSWYYESQFWSEMPDLNLENDSVRQEFQEVADFWLEHDVDGFRLDAVKEFVSGNTEENTEILTWFADYVHAENPDNYIVCECWTDQNTYAKYYASGVDSMFDFAFSGREGVISMAVNGQKGAYTYAKRIQEEEELYSSVNFSYINAPFYTNHDLARSASYYSGENSEAQVKIAQAMNLLMGGNAFIYYGEELGMKGSGEDENKRAPMYWSEDATSEGMCKGPENMGKVEMKYGSLEEQAEDASSIYQYVREAIHIRQRNPEIARGTTVYLEEYSGDEMFALSRTYEDSTVYILGNLSEEEQTVDLNGLDPDTLSVSGELYTGEETASLEEGVLTLPSYSILVLV